MGVGRPRWVAIRWIVRTGRIWLSAFVMRAERREVRMRARAVMGSLLIALALLTALASLLAIRAAEGLVTRSATVRVDGSQPRLDAVRSEAR
jgi:hypothetical protein